MSDRSVDRFQTKIKMLEEQLAAMRLAEAELRMSEDHYRNIFDYAPVSIREEDVTELAIALDELRSQGVSDFRRYFDEHPSFLEKAQQLIQIGTLNDATLSLYGAHKRKELIGVLGKTMDPESMHVFREELASFADGKEIFEGENINLTVDGRKIHVLVKIIYLPKQSKRKKVVVCSVDITKEKEAIKSLKNEMLRNQLILQTTSNGFFIADIQGNIKESNLAASEITGYDEQELLKMDLRIIGVAIPRGIDNINGKASCSKVIERYESVCQKKDGELIDIEVAHNHIEINNEKYMFYFFNDITNSKKAQLRLEEREKELEEQAKALENVNTALKVIINSVETDKNALEDKVLFNVKEMIIPYIDKLKKTHLDAIQSLYAKAILSNLEDIVDSFPNHLSYLFKDLTPSEIQISNFIKQGKSNKYISEIFGLSTRTIETHRRNIRKKLGIQNKGINLRTYLASIEP